MAILKKIQDWLNIRQPVRNGSPKVIVNKVKVAPIHRESQDIGKWRLAMRQAEGHSADRSRLYDLYHDVMLDGVLSTVMQKRIDQVTNRRLIFMNEDGSRNEEISALTETSYFETLLVEMMNAKFWGHSLLEMYWPRPGEGKVGATYLVPRKNVKPRWGIVCEHHYDQEGYDYRSGVFASNTIEVGDPEDLGLLLKVAQYVIYKRGNYGDWAEFNEIFGLPFRWATYNNEQSRDVILEALEKAGPAGYVVAPEDAKLQFLNGNASGQGAEAFRQLRAACNEEITLTFLGNTMTTIEARSSGYAQSETQADGEAEVNRSDRRFVLRLLTEKLLPYLASLGYDTAGSWVYEQEDVLSLAQRIDIDLKLNSIIPISPDYFYEKFGVPKPDPAELPELERKLKEANQPPQPPPGEKAPPEDDPEPKDPEEAPGKPNAQLTHPGGRSRAEDIAALYADHATECPRCVTLADEELPEVKFVRLPRKLQDSVASAVRTGKLGADDISAELHRHYYRRMLEVVKAGFTRNLDPTDDWPDFELTQGLKRNISAFAAAKHSALVEQLITLRPLPKAEYDKAARKVLELFNDTYLRTELLTLEFAALSAGQWRDFVDRADLFPNLQYTTAGDDRVRPVHAQLDGATYPVDHPFWDNHTPPIDWRCRCSLIQTDRPQKDAEAAPTRNGFGGNPGKTRRLIQEDHPYFSLSTDRLTALLELAETLRAAIELKGVKKRARAQVQKDVEVPGYGQLDMTTAEIEALLDTESLSLATRNALIAELELALKEMDQPNGFDPLVVNGEEFRITAEATDNGFRITEFVRL